MDYTALDGEVSDLRDLSDAAFSTALNNAYARRKDLVDTLVAPIYAAHRGGYNVNTEHSMRGYRRAAAHGWLPDTDILTLSDGTLVCQHDTTLDRETTGTGNVSATTRAAWRQLRLRAWAANRW